MVNQDKAVDQLWYTWSDEGLDTIRAGFRIRAASEGLDNVRSVRVQNLDYYQRYFLPRDADQFTISPEIAPICLSLINTGEERILVHKAYTGKDGVGRYGAFFIHLLAGLPKDFTAKDAIALWRSSFWQTSDAGLADQRSTSLNRVILTELMTTRQDRIPFNAQEVASIRKYLPYVIQAYLTKRQVRDEETGQPQLQKLYIAAADNDIAQLIAGLTRCLPNQFVRGLTFSTYEHDVTAATTEIVGTCWLSMVKPEDAPLTAQLLPVQYYREKLALNCYTGDCSPLINNPLVDSKLLAVEFAQDATEYFLQGNTDFQDLLDTANDPESVPNLNVDTFLNLYDSLIVSAQKPSQEKVETALRTSSEKMLSKRGYQKGIIDLALDKRGWWKNFGEKEIRSLRTQSATRPKLAQVLSQLAQYASSRAVALVKEDVPLPVTVIQVKDTVFEITSFEIIIHVMFCAAPPTTNPDIWYSLLNELWNLGLGNRSAFFQRHWNIYIDMIRLQFALLSVSEENCKRMYLFLPRSWADFRDFLELGSLLLWNEFGEFLVSDLPVEWKAKAAQALDSRSRLDREVVRDIENGDHSLVGGFFRSLSQAPQHWSLAKNVFGKLVEKQYSRKLNLLFILLDSEMIQSSIYVEELLQKARLNTDEKVALLERYGPQLLLLSDNLRDDILKMYRELVRHDPYKEKMVVLFSWFASTQFTSWLALPSQGEENLTLILDAADMNAEESGMFLQHYGQHYISLYPRSAALLKLFNRYAKTGVAARLTILNIWLNPQLQMDQATFAQVLESARLTAQEQRRFLEQYGKYAISRYPQVQIWHTYIWEYLNALWATDIDVFQLSTFPTGHSAQEDFLHFLCASPLQGSLPDLIALAYIWRDVATFVRRPSVIRASEEINNNIARFLNTPAVPQVTYTKLITKLALACLDDATTFIASLNTLYTVLIPRDFLLMLYEIAERMGDSLQGGDYNTLFEPYMVFVLSFKKFFFTEEEKQERFVRIFLDALLRDADQKTITLLETRMKQRHANVYADWRSYVSQRSHSQSVVRPPLFEPMNLWWERTIAWTRMRMALASKRAGRIARVDTETMTTLSNSEQEVPEEWWSKIDAALTSLNESEVNEWNRYESQQKLNHGITPPLGKRIKLWWKRTFAFIQMWLALRSKSIGRIVRVATDHMIILDMFDKKVPDEWWIQIDAAFTFFIACEEAHGNTDESTEKAVEKAGKDIASLGYLTLRLTAHEKRRVRIARQYPMKAKNREKMLSLLSARPTQQVTRVVGASSDATVTAQEKPKQGVGLFGWFKKQR